MHRQFDVGATFDENSSNFIITSDEHRKEPLNITSDALLKHLTGIFAAFLVQYDIKCRDIKWVLGGKRQRPVRLKLRKGLPGLNGEYQTYVTVECIIRNDYPENPKSPGDTKLICRPIDVPPEMGSKLIRGHELNFILGKSRVFPIDILFCTEKFEDISENEPLWQKQLRKLQDSSPSHVELLSEVEALRFDTEGEIVDNCLLRAGESLPLEVIAVVRPRMSKVALQKGMNSGKSISGSRTDQKSIVARSSEMVLIVTELKFRPPGERVPPTEKGKEVYISPRSIKATTCCNVSGLYRFKPSQVSDLIMKKTGTYMLTLKILGEDFKDTKPLVIRVNVAASEKGDCWRVCNHAGDCNTAHPGLKSPNLWGRLGEALNWELFLCTYDDYNNPTKFRNINELKNINLELRTLAGECLNDIQLTLPRNFDIKNHISPDHCSLKLQKLELSGGNLATFAPTYQASLWIYIAKKRVAEFRFTVRPGSVGKAVMKEGETPARPLRPGQIIDHLVFQFMDKYGNLAEKGEVVDLALEGLKLCDRKGGSTRKVDDSSCVDLGGRLKVEARYGDTAAVELRNTTFGRTQVLGEFNFDIMKRQLRILNNPKSASGGSKLEDVTIEVVDVETGRVDEDMDGVTYALALGWNKAVCIPLKRGRCTLPDIILPNKTELWTGKVFLAEHPEIRVVMRVEILETWVLPAMENTSEYPPISRIALASLPPQELAKVLEASIERHKELEKKAKQKGRQVGLMESELEERKKRLKMFGERQAYLHNQLRSLQKNEQDEDGGDSEYIEQAEMEEDKLETYNSKKLMSELQKLGDPPGTHAASVLLDAIVDDHRLVEGIGKDVIGLVAILAEVESDSISTALANFLGEDTMTCIICKTVLGIQFLGAHYVGHQSLGLHGLIKDRNSSISGSFGVILADPCSSYKRDDGEQAVIDDHPQKLLHLSPSADSTRPKPLGFIDYAVNLLQFHKGYTLCLKVGEFGLRETLFFNLFGYLQVYDTVENMMRAKEYIQTSAVSLDGGVLYDKRTLHFKTILGKSPTIRFAVASKTEIVDAPQRQPPPARLKLMQEIKKTSNQAAEECSKISVLLKELMQSKNRANQLTQDLTKEAAFTAGLVAKVKENHC
uniref:Uncharacterized protein n=1 Tax=Physcomitrium patens TaxID=3218 RepID=A0A2K1INV9_PHYPA|nr:hypothetical protein PHYPA_027285 [Physcomitrium patens]